MATREQVVKPAYQGGTATNSADAANATVMVTIVNLEIAMTLYATVGHLTLDRTALLLVSSQLRLFSVFKMFFS